MRVEFEASFKTRRFLSADIIHDSPDDLFLIILRNYNEMYDEISTLSSGQFSQNFPSVAVIPKREVLSRVPPFHFTYSQNIAKLLFKLQKPSILEKIDSVLGVQWKAVFDS